jgi:3-deoxy-D-manno-octulosonate 8-phosphate phosphatase (KDO 8-P phosphatase)
MKNLSNATIHSNYLENFPQALERAENIKLVMLDVDGVLTDGALYIGADGKEQIKVFDSLDGHGIKLLASTGVQFAIISGRESSMVKARAKELGIEHVHMAVTNKLETLNALLKKIGGSLKTTAAVGDDWPDLPVLTRVELACAPAQAHPGVLEVAHFVTSKNGGSGAVREICDLILKAQGNYQKLLLEAKS